MKFNKVTWYSKALALVLFIAFPFIGFYFGFQYGAIWGSLNPVAAPVLYTTFMSSSTSAASPSLPEYYKNPAEWQTDRDDKAGISIAYPIDFQANEDHSGVPVDNWRVGTPGGPGLQPFTLTIPKAFEPQTNFDEAVFTIGMSANDKAISQCLVNDSGNPDETTPTTTTVNGITFTVFHFSDAGAGNRYNTTSYRTLHAGECYAVEYTVHSSQIGNYPTSYNLKEYDASKLDALFQNIIGTFKFL